MAVSCSLYPSGEGRFEPLETSTTAPLPPDLPPGRLYVMFRQFVSSTVFSVFVYPFMSYMQDALVSCHILHSCGEGDAESQSLVHGTDAYPCFFFWFDLSRPRFGDVPVLQYRLLFGTPNSASIADRSPFDPAPASGLFAHRAPVFSRSLLSLSRHRPLRISRRPAVYSFVKCVELRLLDR
jgi:hypothetical protein